ncbi:hypothetical protein SUGI_0039330 [Cryptomeria japonica]|nr:hypothetical protein SUGI_0039330 [Cryptomeria japonica]
MIGDNVRKIIGVAAGITGLDLDGDGTAGDLSKVVDVNRCVRSMFPDISISNSPCPPSDPVPSAINAPRPNLSLPTSNGQVDNVAAPNKVTPIAFVKPKSFLEAVANSAPAISTGARFTSATNNEAKQTAAPRLASTLNMDLDIMSPSLSNNDDILTSKRRGRPLGSKNKNSASKKQSPLDSVEITPMEGIASSEASNPKVVSS